MAYARLATSSRVGCVGGSSLAVGSCSFMACIPFLVNGSLGVNAESDDCAHGACNRQFFVRANDANRNTTVRRRNHILIRRVMFFIDFYSKKLQAFADSSADDWRVFTDTTCKDERVQSTKRRREGPDPLFRLITK